jgi:wyosine [tRNA(Phe)-imidazoG37] synthetase (radical SAM superfamily)
MLGTTGRSMVRAGNPAQPADLLQHPQSICRGWSFAEAVRMSLPLIEHIVYGPVRSRRLGVSLGVNLLPGAMKVCNLNCAYCQYGWTRGAVRYRGQGAGWPRPQAVESAVGARLARAADTNEIIDRITVAGHGEPTLNPEFEEIAGRLVAVRDRIAPGVPLAILSNSTTAGAEDVRNGLGKFDERYMKLDAGDPITYAQINGAACSMPKIVDALRALPPVTVQSMFISDPTGKVDNTGEGTVSEWLMALEEIRAARVHIYTIDRPPALASLRPVPRRRLREIAEHVRAAGIPADIFSTPSRR